MTTTVSGSQITFNDNSTQNTAATGFGFKNRIINGAMAVAQRGTSVTTSGGYTLDRWNEVSGNSNQHIQSTDAPTGFKYSMQVIGTGGNLNQRIESLNCQDLSGQTVIVSFWVKNTSGTDSLIAALYYCNSADNFSSLTQIGSTVTLSSNPSSSWTQYTTTFTNLPSGSQNGLSLYIARSGSASTTWYFTGVQLERGSTATSFDYRPYGQELQLCQRYYQSLVTGGLNLAYNTTTLSTNISFPVTMRGTPTVALNTAMVVTLPGVANYTQSPSNISIDDATTSGARCALANFTGLTQYRNYMNICNGTYLMNFSSEL